MDIQYNEYEPPRTMETLPDLLARHAHRIWRGNDAPPVGPHISTGYRELDQVIGGGWPTGNLVELLTVGVGLGESMLLLPALATLTQAGKALAWLPRQDERPYAPALHQNGVDLSRVMIIDTEEHQQRLWAAEQCLRSGSCGAMVLTETRTITDTLLRRLKLAASSGNATAFVLRGETAATSPSPASLRIRVRRQRNSQHSQISVLKCGSHPPRSISLDLNARSH